MYEMLIKNYINNLKLKDMKLLLSKNNILLNENEDVILYKYLKTRSDDFFNGNINNILNDLKKEVSPTTFNLIMEYYEKYKDYL